MSNPGTPAPTPSHAISFSNHTLHPDAILAGLCYLGGDEGTGAGLLLVVYYQKSKVVVDKTFSNW